MHRTSADKAYMDMFGTTDPAQPSARKRGHAAWPGTGPVGEKCMTCNHIVRHRRSKTYIKCGLTNWTHGPATDIRANDPACDRWDSALGDLEPVGE